MCVCIYIYIYIYIYRRSPGTSLLFRGEVGPLERVRPSVQVLTSGIGIYASMFITITVHIVQYRRHQY